MTKPCSHPKEKRSLLDGYEVVCECGQAIGRVALHGHDVVLNQSEARDLLSKGIRENGNLESKLRSVA